MTTLDPKIIALLKPFLVPELKKLVGAEYANISNRTKLTTRAKLEEALCQVTDLEEVITRFNADQEVEVAEKELDLTDGETLLRQELGKLLYPALMQRGILGGLKPGDFVGKEVDVIIDMIVASSDLTSEAGIAFANSLKGKTMNELVQMLIAADCPIKDIPDDASEPVLIAMLVALRYGVAADPEGSLRQELQMLGEIALTQRALGLHILAEDLVGLKKPALIDLIVAHTDFDVVAVKEQIDRFRKELAGESLPSLYQRLHLLEYPIETIPAEATKKDLIDLVVQETNFSVEPVGPDVFEAYMLTIADDPLAKLVEMAMAFEIDMAGKETKEAILADLEVAIRAAFGDAQVEEDESEDIISSLLTSRLTAMRNGDLSKAPPVSEVVKTSQQGTDAKDLPKGFDLDILKRSSEYIGKPFGLLVAGTGSNDSFEDTFDDKTKCILFRVDSGAELERKGLVHDGITCFSIDAYMDYASIKTFGDIEDALLDDPHFKQVLVVGRAKIFSTITIEKNKWSERRNDHVDPTGGGGSPYKGYLRWLWAFRGRTYGPEKFVDGSPNPNYRQEDDPKLNDKLRARSAKTTHIDLLNDLIVAFEMFDIDMLVVAGGFGGATGSSTLIISDQILRKACKAMDYPIAVMPVTAVGIPSYFLLRGKVNPVYETRLRSLVKTLDKSVVMTGFGHRGVWWRALVDYARELASIFSNLEAEADEKGTIPILTMVVIPNRGENLQHRYLAGLMSGTTANTMSKKDILEVLQFYAKLKSREIDGEERFIRRPLLKFRVKEHRVSITSENAHDWTIEQWNELAPVLVDAHQLIGDPSFTIPMKTGRGRREKIVNRMLHSIPVLDVIEAAINKTAEMEHKKAVREGRAKGKYEHQSLANLLTKVDFISLARAEKKLINANMYATFKQTFLNIHTNFITMVINDLRGPGGVFENMEAPPITHSYDDPQAVVAYGIINSTYDDYAERVFSVFAEIDRTKHIQAAQDHVDEVDTAVAEASSDRARLAGLGLN